jgi:ion channel-forming bestrophin family protein
MSSYQTRKGFWREAIAIQGSVTIKVLPSILLFGVIASLIVAIASFLQRIYGISYTLDISPFAFAGAVLGILLVIRLNAGYDRWWEARSVWGGIVNQCRNLVISARAFGPQDRQWRESLIHWVAVFPQVACNSLRGEQPTAELARLIGPEELERLGTATHPPSYVAFRIGELLRDANQRLGMDGFSFIQLDRERAMLMDHIGVCERILATPLPRIYSITIRRFILLFLLLLPIALLQQGDEIWSIPLIIMLVSYPLLTLDQIGVELENPFSVDSLSHLPIDDLAAKIERNLLDLRRDQKFECLSE